MAPSSGVVLLGGWLSRGGKQQRTLPPTCLPQIEVLEDRLTLSTFRVTNTNDSGLGSLRQAILDANTNPGLDTIAFDIGGGGVQTIRPASALPSITSPVLVEGNTQPGYAGRPLIVLNGGNAGANANGLTVAAANTTVRGLVINGFGGIAVELASGVNGVISGNFIGTDAAGTAAVANGDGIVVRPGSGGNLIGGLTLAARNLISGNRGSGIRLFGHILTPPSNLVQGNYIGTDVTGTRALGNRIGVEARYGFDVIGGTVAGARNVISGNEKGVALYDGGNLVQGNYIGTDASGTAVVPNRVGVMCDELGRGNTIGGTASGAGNLISGNELAGIEIRGAEAYNNAIHGNSIGTDVTGTVALRNGYGIYINSGGSSTFIGGPMSGARNLISGNITGIRLFATTDVRIEGNYIGTNVTGTAALSNLVGIEALVGSTSFIGGMASGARNVISGNYSAGILLTSAGNRVQGNYVGLNAAGTAALPNPRGILVAAPNTLIGGTAPGAGNVVSGNTIFGIELSGAEATGNRVEGNFIGTDAAGRAAVPNNRGVWIAGTNNTVGGAAAGARNVISGNSGNGISLVGGSNVVQGNYIGTDVTGTLPVGNLGGLGIAGDRNVIGGTTAGARNVISGNQLGLAIGGLQSVVQGNYVGTDVSGTRPLGNRDQGIDLGIGGYHTIGGMAPGAGNVISGNGLGLYLRGPYNTVQGNYIGTDASGTRALGNRAGGVWAEVSNNTIGGTTPAARNIISGNWNGGVSVAPLVAVQGNYIGTDVTGRFAVPNIGFGVSANRAVIGGSAPGAGNLISGNTGPGIILSSLSRAEGNRIGTDATGTATLGNSTGILVYVDRNVIGGTEPGAGNLISGNRDEGIRFASGSATGNRVQGNFIGTNASGSARLGNGHGVVIAAGADNLIGGTVPAARNLISGNKGSGVVLQAARGVVQGNWIGLDATGAVRLGNGASGIQVSSGLDTLIGGTTQGAGNVISGNRIGVVVDASRALVQGNLIGTNILGTRAVANGEGVSVGGSDNTIGGTALAAGNVISGNTRSGIRTRPGSAATRIQGNFIGIDVTGIAALGNGEGISIDVGAPNNTIGGTVPEAANFISGNARDGIVLRSSGNQVMGNIVGISLIGAALGNGGAGVAILGSGNSVGGAGAGAANLIAFNGGDGVFVDAGTGNAIRRNVIVSHDSGLGIRLANGGNREREFPILYSAVSGGGVTTVEGLLVSAPNMAFEVEIFVNAACNPSGFGEGERFLGTRVITTDADGLALFTYTAAVEVEPGQFLTATATDPTNNTSQFSPCAEVGRGLLPGSRSARPLARTEGDLVWQELVAAALDQLTEDHWRSALPADAKTASATEGKAATARDCSPPDWDGASVASAETFPPTCDSHTSISEQSTHVLFLLQLVPTCLEEIIVGQAS